MNKKEPTDVSVELSTNLNDLRNKIIKETDIDIIALQTGHEDRLEIERILIESENDVSKAILNLMSLKYQQKEPKESTIFDQIREILDDKDRIYHDVQLKNRMQQQ